MKKFTLAILAVMFLMGALAGCNATRGAGQDISDTGQHIKNIGQ